MEAKRRPIERPLRVLLAEDNEVNQLLTLGILRRGGHDVVVAVHGRAAVEAFGRESFDLVLMDVQMPDLDGFQATAAIRREEAARAAASGAPVHTPVIAMTADASDADRQRCLAAGMDAHVSKPVRAQELLGVIRRVVDGGPLAPAATQTTNDPEPAALILDRAEVLEYFNGDATLLREVTASFRARAPELMATLGKALATGDAPATSKAAHKIKGLVGFLGATSVMRAAQRIESLSMASDLDDARQAYGALDAELARLLDALPALLEG